MSRAVQLLRPLLIATLAIAYALLAHFTNTTGGQATLGTVLALAPIACVILSIAWHSDRRIGAFLVIGTVCLLLSLTWDTISRHYDWIYWAEHAGTQGFLFYFFGRTLRPGREPLCSQIARLVHGSLTPTLERYTRQITFAWTCFFGLMATGSTLLFFVAPLASWSWFANFLTAPLIALMFLAEYAVRRFLHPEMEHAHILDAVRIFWKAPAG